MIVRSGGSPAGPSAAERARTTLARADTLAVLLGGRRRADGTGAGGPVDVLAQAHDVHALEIDGSVLVLADARSALADAVAEETAGGGAVPCVVHAALVCPLAGPDRRVDPVTLLGRLELIDAAGCGEALEVLVDAHPTRRAAIVLRPEESVLLRIVPVQIRLAGAPIDPELYARAVVDPVSERSDRTVAHLVYDHPAEVMTLLRLVEGAVLVGGRSAAPVRIDRFGVTLRVEYEDHSTADTRLEFPVPLDGPDDVGPAVRDLVARAAAQPCRCAGSRCASALHRDGVPPAGA